MVGVIVKFLIDPFKAKEEVIVKQDEIVIEEVPVVEATPTPATPTPAPAPVEAKTEIVVPAKPAAPVATAKKIALNTSYGSPAGPEEVGFALNVDASGIITSAETIVKATDDKSIKYQNSFKKEFATKVVGKKLSDLSSVDKVGKASLTTNAFNASLGKLKAQL
jgi:hypothetical protein